jgi:hypothetical protein
MTIAAGDLEPIRAMDASSHPYFLGGGVVRLTKGARRKSKSQPWSACVTVVRKSFR